MYGVYRASLATQRQQVAAPTIQAQPYKRPKINMQNLNEKTITQLKALAKKYETHSFIENDPSQFLYKFQNQQETEIISFIAAMLSFGKRDQFIKKIRSERAHV